MAVLLTAMANDTLVAAGGTVPLGSAVHGCGNAIKLFGNSVQLREKGYYNIDLSATVAVTGTDELDITMYQDGVAVANATAGATPTAAGDSVNISLPWIVRKGCCCDATSISFAAGAAGTFSNVICKVVRE